MALVEIIYKITDTFPKTEQYGLSSQMQRSVVSIPSNIAESRKKKTRKDFCKYLQIAYGSGGELETHIEIVKHLPFGKGIDFQRADTLLLEIMKILNVMIR